MDSKTVSFYNAFWKFAKEDIESNPESILTFFKSILKIDFDQFVNCWEYLLTKKQSLLSREYFDKIFSIDTAALGMEKNAVKTIKAITSNPVISRATFGESHYSAQGACLDVIIYLLITQKTTEADYLLKLLQRNSVIQTSFGENMVVIVEKLFFEMLKKQGNVSKKVDLPKKLSTLLTSFISKIKGPEKALLEQRLREIQ